MKISFRSQKNWSILIILDDHGNDDSMTVLEELEQIDDDCDKHGIQFVKIDDAKTAEEFGIDTVFKCLKSREAKNAE